MSYFKPKPIESSGNTKYKVSIDASDKRGLITTFYFSVFADSESKAISKVKNAINNSNQFDRSYLAGDHLTLEYNAR